MKKWLIGIAIFVGVIIAIAAVGVLAAWNISGFSASAAKAGPAYADWQAKGLPITQDQIYLSPAPEDIDNAAFTLEQARTMLREKGRAKLTAEATSDAGWKSGEMAKIIAANADVIEVAMQAAERPGIRIARDWDLGASVLFPEFADTKELAKLLSFDAILKARAGDGKGAAKRIYASRRLAWMAAEDPTLIGALVGIAIDAIAVNAAGQCAAELAGDAGGLQALRQGLEDSNWSVDASHTMRGEAYISLASFRNLNNRDIFELATNANNIEASWDTPKTLARDGLPREAMPKAVAAELMTFWSEFYPRMIDPKVDVSALGRDMDDRVNQLESSGSKPKQIAAIFSPVYRQALRAMQKQVSEQATAIAYVGILQYRAKYKKWPASLKDAGVDGQDVLAGAPIRYKSNGDAARVWHVGQNGVDNGGLHRFEAIAKGLNAQDADNVYLYPWPPRPK